MIRTIVTIAAVTISLLPQTVKAGESANARANRAQWAVSDKCNRDAITKFPDHTSDALTKREQYVRQCNLNSRLPARAPLPVQAN
jgi:hypothetical protein